MSIQHIEDLALADFIRVVRNIETLHASEKIDGSSLWLGIDSEGRLFTSREGKRKGSKNFYSEAEYPRFGAYNGFRSAHAALQAKEEDIRRIMRPGQTVEMEILYGRQPNAITYGADNKSYIAFLRGVQGTPNVIVDQLAMTLGGTSVKVNVDIIDTSDGEKLEIRPAEITYQFTGAQKIPAEKLKAADFKKHLNALEKFLKEPAGLKNSSITNLDLISNSLGTIDPDIRPEAKQLKTNVLAKVMTDFKLPIKKELLDNYVSKIKPALSAVDITADEDVGIEGVVLRDPTTGDLIKLVDKDAFTTINSFNHAIRNQVSGVVKTLDGTAPLEARGGILGNMKIQIADLLGNKELARGSTAKRSFTTVKGSSPVETVKNFSANLSIEDFLGMKRKMLALIRQAAIDLKSLLEYFKEHKDDFQLKLKNGKTIGISDEITKRTYLVFAESRRNVLELFEKIKKAETVAQVVAILYGHLAKAVHDASTDETVTDVKENLLEMDLYKFHTKPETLDLHAEAAEKVPEVVWEKYKNNPKELKKREKALAKSVKYAYLYARDVLKGRFQAGEAVLAKDPNIAYNYANDILQGPFPAGEAAIAKDPEIAFKYAYKVLDGPFPAGEAAIATSAHFAYEYARRVLRGPFPAGEEAIAKTGYLSSYVLSYAMHVLRLPDEEAIKWGKSLKEELLLEKKNETDKALYSGKDAYTLMNIYFATVFMAVIMYQANNALGIRLLKDKTHYRMLRWDKDMSPLNFWGYPIWHASSPAVKKLIGNKTAAQIFKIARRAAPSQPRYLHMDLSFGKDVPIEWTDHKKTLRILQQLEGMNVDRINILMDGVFKYENLTHDAKVKIIGKLFYYAQQFIPTSSLFLRLKEIQSTLLLNAADETQEIVSEMKLLTDVNALVEEDPPPETAQVPQSSLVSQIDIATRAADANPTPGAIKKHRIVKRKRNPEVKKAKFPRPKPESEVDETA